MTKIIPGPTDGPNPNTTPSARMNRLGRPSLALPLVVSALAALALIAVLMVATGAEAAGQTDPASAAERTTSV